MQLKIPVTLAWIYAILGLVLPLVIVINPGRESGLDSTFGTCSLAIMVFILIQFLADIIISVKRYKAFWITAVILVPSIAQIAYLICRRKILIE